MTVGAGAATGRGDYNRVGRTATGSAQRMPTMPTMSINTVGNLTPNLPSTGSGNVINGGGIIGDGGNNGGNNGGGGTGDKCDDGSSKDSAYTVEHCMDDILMCINNGALPGGLNDMFNSDLRNSIINGMGLCSAQIDSCLTDVRIDCNNVYKSRADVWIDFNTRRVQPEYYNFVLRKTGLTPYQAENTCMLLDRNTYGSSFAAVNANNNVTTEYNQLVGAYNHQEKGSLTKDAPMGVDVNTQGSVDAERGHYARWDATTANCLVRVAAYNKDKQISNSWLFGAVGSDKPAEVWKNAGDTFTCNKDLFGFSLFNDTQTVAVVGVGGGTLLGAGIGALSGHDARDFKCDDDKQRAKLAAEIRKSNKVGIINQYMTTKIDLNNFSDAMCTEFIKLYTVYEEYDAAVSECERVGAKNTVKVVIKFPLQKDDSGSDTINGSDFPYPCNTEMLTTNNTAPTAQDYLRCYYSKYIKPCSQDIYLDANTGPKRCAEYLMYTYCNNGGTAEECKAALVKAEVDVSEVSLVKVEDNSCVFKSINEAKKNGGSADSIFCKAGEDCVSYMAVRGDLNNLGPALKSIDIVKGEKSNRGATTAIGAGVGAGAGGVATAITAFVERNNINCRVGDGLDVVGFNKSYSIGTLKDFYVKWNLRLPEKVAPTAQVSDCKSLRDACAQFSVTQCPSAEVIYRAPGDETSAGTLIEKACMLQGSVCVHNTAIYKIREICKINTNKPSGL